MSLNSPAPTPERALYGYVLYLTSFVLFVFILCWAYIPDFLFKQTGITYCPQKYWAIAIPAIFTFLFALGLLLYTLLNFINTWALTDEIKGYSYVNKSCYEVSGYRKDIKAGSIPPLKDYRIENINCHPSNSGIVVYFDS